MTARSLAALALALLLPLALARPASAAIQASFDAGSSAWHATHIVLAREEEPGEYAVLESWEGDLAPGARVALPDLAARVPAERRRLGLPLLAPDGEERRLIRADRMVLFLRRRDDGTFGPAKPDDERGHFLGEIDVSVAWIDGGRVYGLEQVMNPGAPVMADQRLTEEALRDLVRATLVARGDLARAAATADPERRPGAIAPFVRDASPIVSQAALDALASGGAPAAAALERLLREDPATPRGAEIVDALRAAAGLEYEAIARGLLRDEVSFWRRAAPGLEPEWWAYDRAAGETRPLGRRHGTLLRLVYSLRGGAGDETRAALVELRDLWRSEERLGGALPQLLEACEEALRREHGCRERVLGRYLRDGKPAFTIR